MKRNSFKSREPAEGDLWFPRYSAEGCSPPQAQSLKEKYKILPICGDLIIVILSAKNPSPPQSDDIVFLCEGEFWQMDYYNFVNWTYPVWEEHIYRKHK